MRRIVLNDRGELVFRESATNGTNEITVRAPASLAADVALALPSSSGNLSVETPVTYYTSAEIAVDGTGSIITDINHGESFTPDLADLVSLVAYVSSGYESSDPPGCRDFNVLMTDGTKIRVYGYVVDAGYAGTKMRVRVGFRHST